MALEHESRFRKFLNSKVCRVLLVLLAILAAVQIATYCWYADAIIPRTGIRNLLDFKLLRGARFVVVEPKSWAALSDSQRTVLVEEFSRYVDTIYDSMDDVPESDLVYEPTTEHDKKNYEDWQRMSSASLETLERLARQLKEGRRLAGLKNGMQLGCTVERHSLFWMKCTAFHWISGTGAEGRSDIYVWVLGRWVRIYNEYHVMS